MSWFSEENLSWVIVRAIALALLIVSSFGYLTWWLSEAGMLWIVAVVVLVAAFGVVRVVYLARVRRRSYEEFKRERAEREAAWTKKSDLDPDVAEAFDDGEMSADQMDRLLKATELTGPVRQCDDPEAYYDEIVEHDGDPQTCSRCK